MSHHIGDMENLATLSAFEKGIEHFKAMYDVEPEVIAYDFHPDYLSTQFAHQYPDFTSAGKKITKIGIQHHHAHAVSCMAENGIEEPVIAAVLDGTGRGSDNTIWGGEFLLAEFTKFRRLGCLKPVLMPGGQASIDHPWQMAMGYLFQIFGENLPELPFLKSVPAAKKRMVHYNFKNKINSPITTSCGRLFDAVAAMAGLRNDVFYEGQAAVEFEQAVTSDINKKYSFQIKQQQELLILDWEPMIRELVDDIHNQTGLGIISAKFHNGLANAIGEMVLLIRDEYQNNKVVLSGGVFMNMVLLQKVKNNLTEKNFEVYTHQQVPTNDGGISLGQAVIANAVLQKSR